MNTQSQQFVGRRQTLLAAVAMALALAGCGGGSGDDEPEKIPVRFENFTGFTVVVRLVAIVGASGAHASPSLRPGENWEVPLESEAEYSWIAFDGDERVDGGVVRPSNALVIFIDATSRSPKSFAHPTVYLDGDTCWELYAGASDLMTRRGGELHVFSTGGSPAIELMGVFIVADRTAMTDRIVSQSRVGDLVLTADAALRSACEVAGAHVLSPQAHGRDPSALIRHLQDVLAASPSSPPSGP